MKSPKQLTRSEILRAARDFEWTRKMPKWRVVVEDRELPARPLVLEAAGVPPNDPTNSHQAVAILEGLGFETRYAGGNGKKTEERKPLKAPDTPTDIDALFETVRRISSRVPDEAWAKVPTDLSINLDHYLYGHPRKKE
ncbi:MAG: hypothetical protein WA857_17625 [Candidatus Acidiferrum sp.]